MYQKLVDEITQTFKKISEAIIDIQKQLDAGGHSSIARIIVAVQGHEKHKLELVSMKSSQEKVKGYLHCKCLASH